MFLICIRHIFINNINYKIWQWNCNSYLIKKNVTDVYNEYFYYTPLQWCRKIYNMSCWLVPSIAQT